MRRDVGTVRSSQLVTTYGVGAIVAAGSESFVVGGLDYWPDLEPDVDEPRLQRLLGVSGFVSPPSAEAGRRHGIPVARFPEWYFCVDCHALDPYRYLATRGGKSTCSECDGVIAPSRFVVACKSGHLTDFPYFRWVHWGQGVVGTQHRLTLKTEGGGSSLADVVVKCSCGRTRTMEDAFRGGELRKLGRCKGGRPWLTTRAESCDQFPRTLQRGASIVWQSDVASAISIPPWSDGAYKLLGRYWKALRAVPDDALEQVIEAMGLADGSEYTTGDLAEQARRRKGTEAGAEDAEPLKQQEYEALCRERPERSRRQDFVCEERPLASDAVAAVFGQVMCVRRLREVRALRGFTRVEPLAPGFRSLRRPSPLLSLTPTTWLPAIEVRGEGVFLRIADGPLVAWESRPSVRARAELLNGAYAAAAERRGSSADRVITARFIMLHTLAHLLIQQWSMECGYSAASLRERLYVDSTMAGLLIYTATSDSAGSLGGVVAMASADHLNRSVREAVARASWCSSDPLCLESTGQGVDSLNLAACHACGLLPETSCEERNLLLDRALIVGLAREPEVGFFSELVT